MDKKLFLELGHRFCKAWKVTAVPNGSESRVIAAPDSNNLRLKVVGQQVTPT